MSCLEGYELKDEFITTVKVQNGWFLMVLCFIPRQLRFSLYSGAVITEGLM